MKPASIEELLVKAQKPSADALRLHPLYKVKLAVVPKCPIRSLEDFAIWYSPGVAAPCRDIAEHPEQVLAHTNKGNFVAVVSDGTRVLGLGDTGSHAALPVRKAKQFCSNTSAGLTPSREFCGLWFACVRSQRGTA
jgi:malate dehydrogenase (oxaloacetate-decarboxylating)